jgi:hypothetical protein
LRWQGRQNRPLATKDGNILRDVTLREIDLQRVAALDGYKWGVKGKKKAA